MCVHGYGILVDLSPSQRINYPVVRRRKQISHAVRRNDPEDPRGPAPSYEVHPRGANIAPPNYEDALHDVLVYSAESQQQVNARTCSVTIAHSAIIRTLS